MADFRKVFFALAGLLILISSASAQVTTTLACTAFVANQPILRAEGATEPAGDIIIQCQGNPTPGAQTGPQTLTLYTSAAVASRAATVNGITYTDAALYINDTGTPVQGVLQNGALVFSGGAEPFNLPQNGPNNNQFSVRITNVRLNALLTPGTFVTGTLLATFPIQNQGGLVLGVVQKSLNVTVAASTTAVQQCTVSSTTQTGTITIGELVNTAFKLQGTPSSNTPGQWYQNGINTESQTITTGGTLPVGWTSPGAIPGYADSATRFRINISNIPAGVTVTLPVSISSGTGSTTPGAGFIVATTGGETGAFAAATGSTISLTAAGSVTYEVRQQDPNGLDVFPVPVTVSFTTAAPGNAVSVSATYGPTTSETSTKIPRFSDISAGNLSTLFSIAPCQTDLLFTFLTNQAGFDTGFEIANTGSDPFGSVGQSGTCSLNWYQYSNGAPVVIAPTTVGPIAPGQVYTNLVSSAMAGFQGYMIAVCNFTFGHGFAFVSDGYGQPGRGLSQGYLAQIIPVPALNGNVRSASAPSYSAKGSGEGLGN